MRLFHVPYRVVLLASILPWIAAFLDSKPLTLAPDVGLFTIVAIALVLTGKSLPIISNGLGLALGLVLLHTFIVILDGRGIGSGGSLLLMLEVYCFAYLLGFENKASLAGELHIQISRLYKLHLLFLLFELLARIVGALDLFVSIAGTAETVMVYKTYNTAALLQYFGMSGLNSLLLGSQTASQLTLFSLIWFFPFYHGLNGKWGRSGYLTWFIVALVFYPFNATMTVNVILIIYVVIFIFFNKDTFLSRPKYKYMLILFCVILMEVLIELVAFRLQDEKDIEIYMHAYTHLVDVIGDIPFHYILFGWGADIDGRPVEDSNFGIGMIFFQSGLLFIFPLFLFFLIVYKRFTRAAKLPNELRTPDFRNIKTLAMLNGLMALGWGVSLIHYTPAIELGGRHLFAFHMAIVIHLTNILIRSCSSAVCKDSSRPVHAVGV